MPKATAKAKHPAPAPIKQQHQTRRFYWAGYHTQRWRKARLRFLQHNPECVECKKENRSIPAKVVDHIKPIETGAIDPWDYSNWQGLCIYHDASKRGKTTHNKG